MDRRNRKLSRSVAHFQEYIGSWAEDVQQGVASLKRVNDYGPNVGALEFKHALSELDEEVSELAQQTQHLERFTVDSQSMEELVGHCSQLYQSNRTGMQKLQAHLAQYGYQSPGPLQHPQNPLSLVHPASARADQAHGLGQYDGKEDMMQPSSARSAGQHRTQAGTTGCKTRLHARQQTPGIQTKDLPASEEDEKEEEEEDMELAELSFKHQLSGQEAQTGKEGSVAEAGDTSKQGNRESAAPDAPLNKATHNRHSMASSDSSTPEAFMSPSLAALQAKYGANAQATQSSHEQVSAQDQATNNSSTVPGYQPDQVQRDPKSESSPAPEQPHINLPGRANRLGLSPPVVEDDTCSLYQQLIRSKDVPSSITAALSNSSSSNSNNNKSSAPGASSSTNRAALAAAATVANAGRAGAERAQGSRAAGEVGSMTGLHHQQQQQQQAGAGAPPQLRTTPSPLLRRSPSATEAMAAAKNQPLAAKLASLETMWVSSGQAARSPTPKRAQAALAKAHALGSDQDSPTAVPPEVRREAQAMATRMSADFSSSSASHKLAAHGDVRSSTGSTALTNHSTRPPGSKLPLNSGAPGVAAAATRPDGGSDFAFAPVQPAAAPANVGQGKPSTAHATPAWPALHTGARGSTSNNPAAGGEAVHNVQGAAGSDPGHSGAPSSTLSAHSAHSTHITPAMDHLLLSKYASTSPLSTANLSPGTSSLLNRVFGSQHTQSGRSSGASASGPASADSRGAGQASKPLPFQQPAPRQPPAPHHPPQYSAPGTNPPPPPTQRSPAPQPTEPATLSGARSSSTVAGVRPLTSHPLDRNSSLLRTSSSSTTIRSNSGTFAVEGDNGETGAAMPNPALAVVSPEAYATLPLFLRSQLPLDLMNATLHGVASLLRQQDHDPRAVTMGELEGLGLDTQRSKVFVNALCKLGKAQMQGSSRFLCMPMS
ncbi:hypothetical protein DUNSADRAFT_2919 [Dunaliella salina]|uniref:Spindle and kinetochore-associated protein 3 n=1 Tax=Dunaliella salina TaxID=3046 RepID=A0ABQ7GUZ2_DUNSA|nr:hypothetical protein DUNSADRAFT_2919 [Dunaliella salina]|eukprot:KAF5838383.1 hypothetical protein DUNSADRAFT_2919 [Dunaliella salina]